MSNLCRDSAAFRPRRLDNAPLDYEPENELGVVFLFSHVARKQYGLRVDQIQAGFPDCIAYRGKQRVRIEFEYRARSFNHDHKKCDCIVCWIDDWPAKPKGLEVIELRKYYGLGFNVWLDPMRESAWEDVSRARSLRNWSAPSQASVGDLVLLYRVAPCSYIGDVFEIRKQVTVDRPGDWNRRKKDWFADLRRVATLKTPLHLEEIKQHKILKDAGFVRGSMRGRPRVTPHWPWLLEMIVARNPSLRQPLGKYGPDRV